LASKAKPARPPAAKAKPKSRPSPAKKPAPPSKSAKKPAPKPVAKPPVKPTAKAPAKPAAKPAAKSSSKKSVEAETSTAIPLRGDGRRHLLSLSFLRDGEEFTARLETDAGQITELKNRSLDQLLTLVASELEDLLE
jgi:outer membrane biosynthesis protein TonB